MSLAVVAEITDIQPHPNADRLEVIRKSMAATIEKAKADDPRELRKRIAELERELRNISAQKKQPDVNTVEKVVRVEVPVYPEKVRDWLRETAGKVESSASELHNLAKMLRQGAEIKVVAADRLRREVSAEELISKPTPRSDVSVRSISAPTVKRQPDQARPPASNGRFSQPQHRILDALARLEAAHVPTPTRTQAAALAGVSPKSSGFEKNVSTLSSAELITYPAPGRLALTHEGRSQAADVIEPPTVEEFQDYLCRLISGPQAALLRALILVYPESRTREQLASLVDVSPLSSGFEKNVSTLSSFGFVSYPERGSVAATPLVFLEDA